MVTKRYNNRTDLSGDAVEEYRGTYADCLPTCSRFM